MSAHNFPWEWRNAQAFEPDPGDGKTIYPKKGMSSFALTYLTETRSLIAPDRAGQILLLSVASHGTSCTVTLTTGTFAGGSNTIATFNSANDMLMLISMQVGTVYKWAAALNIGTVGFS